jgi:hypothetical protein
MPAAISQSELLLAAMTLGWQEEATVALGLPLDPLPACATTTEIATIPTATNGEVQPREATPENGRFLPIESLSTRLAIATIGHRHEIEVEAAVKIRRFCQSTKV